MGASSALGRGAKIVCMPRPSERLHVPLPPRFYPRHRSESPRLHGTCGGGETEAQ